MKSSKTGFTILETALAMAFISFLMLAIGFAVVQISNVYQKGITIKVVNNNGRELIDELSRSILASKYDKTADKDDSNFKYTYFQKTGKVLVGGDDEKEVPLYGAFCLGNYSYIWNTGYALNLEDKSSGGSAPSPEDPANSSAIEYNPDKAYIVLGEGDEEKPFVPKLNFRLARVADTGREACKGYAEKIADINNNDPLNKITIQKASENNYVEIISPSENDLVLYDFTVFEPFYHAGTGHALYSSSFILGTMGGGVDITIPGNFCTEKPEGLRTDFNYCSINKFNFAARATGGLAI